MMHDYYKQIHFVGIGGAGVSALAGLCRAWGITVTGSDAHANERTIELEAAGATVVEGAAPELAAAADVLVYSPAVPDTDPDRQAAAAAGVAQLSYPEFLGRMSEEMYTVAVAGTNGKTTTTAMLAQIATAAGLDPTVVVGGVMQGTGRAYRAGGSQLLIVEACEYKESFLNLEPNMVVLTNMTPDHLDYFGTAQKHAAVFAQLVGRLPDDGVLVCDPSDSRVAESVLTVVGGRTVVDWTTQVAAVPELLLPGEYNRHNAAAAAAAALTLGATAETASQVLAQFVGTKRRFEYLGQTENGAKVYDDYAHNVEGVAGLIAGLREMFVGQKIVLVFQPHLYSRTKQFLGEFAAALSEADEVYLLPIYAAREVDDGTVSSADLAEQVKTVVQLCEGIDDAVAKVGAAGYGEDSVVVTVGAGEAWKVGRGILV